MKKAWVVIGIIGALLAVGAGACWYLNVTRPSAAAKVLARAIAKQGMPPVADSAADLPLALRASFEISFRDDHENEVSIYTEWRFLAPNLIFTRAVDRFTEVEVYTGFDGKKPWSYSEKAGLRDLNGPEAAKYLKQLQLDAEMTETLARAFLLWRLQRELKEVHLLDDVTTNGITASVVEGTTAIEIENQKKTTVLRLYLEQKEARLIGARVMIEGESPLQFWFTKHESIGGVDIPRKIEIYRGDPLKLKATVWVLNLELAPALTHADFKPPKS